MTVIAIPRILQDKLTEPGAQALLDILNQVGEQSKDNILIAAESKFEKRLAEEIESVRVEIARSKAEIIRWLFIFWVGQIGILFAFFKK